MLALFLLLLAPTTQVHHLERPDGTRITYYLDLPAQQPCSLAFILQGSECLTVAHKYRPFIEDLNRRGIGVVRIEKPGLTAETPEGVCPEEYLLLNTLDRRVLDVLEVTAALRRRPEWNGKLGLAGGSEGGVIAAMAAPLVPETRAVVMLASAGGLPFSEEIELLVASEMEAAGAPPEAVAERRRQMAEEMREIEVHPDPHREWMSDDRLARNTWLWWSRALPVAAVRPLLRVDVPILMVHGRTDGATPFESVTRLEESFREAGKTNLVFERYDGGHAPPPDAVARALAWLADRL